MTEPILEIQQLNYRYPEGHQALVDVTFSLERGEVVGLVGPNGAGKSTLLLHLNGLLGEQEPSKQSIKVGGLAVAKQNLPKIRQRVGLVFQDPDDQLFCTTVLEDIAFGPRNLGQPPAAARQTALQALADVGLSAALADRSPHRLSLGERKRVCLAGVLACQPELLALDEPSSNLDPRGRRQLIENLQSLSMAMLIATHDLEMVLELCSRVLILDEGRIVADGPAAEILSQADLMFQHGLEVPVSLAQRCES